MTSTKKHGILYDKDGFQIIWCVCTKLKNRGWTKDGDYWVCSICRKPSQAFVNICDNCGEYFFVTEPAKFQYPCPSCEQEL